MDVIEDIEDLIPHRERMKLIDTITFVDQEHAVTRATVKESWPLYSGDAVSAIVLIELAAQTAGVCIGWNEKMKSDGPMGEAKGWLVGIKNARFYVNTIPLDSCIITRSENRLVVENYKEIVSTASVGEKLVGEISLQILHV